MTAGLPYDWSAIYAANPLPRLADVNTMSLPDAFLWYNRNGFNVHPGIIGEDGERKLILPPGYRFDTLLEADRRCCRPAGGGLAAGMVPGDDPGQGQRLLGDRRR